MISSTSFKIMGTTINVASHTFGIPFEYNLATNRLEKITWRPRIVLCHLSLLGSIILDILVLCRFIWLAYDPMESSIIVLLHLIIFSNILISIVLQYTWTLKSNEWLTLTNHSLEYLIKIKGMIITIYLLLLTRKLCSL